VGLFVVGKLVLKPFIPREGIDYRG